MPRTVATLGLLLALAAPAAAAVEPAADYIKALYRLQIGQKYGQVWETLHPAQRAFVTRKRFIACETKRRVGFRLQLKTIRVLSQRPERLRIEGTGQYVSAVAIRIKIDVLVNGFLNRETIDTHAIRVKGDWAWSMDRATAVAYKAGRCPA